MVSEPRPSRSTRSGNSSSDAGRPCVGPVLIDIATHTLGISALAGSPYSPELEFVPIIRRNSPLPAKYEDIFQTTSPNQEKVDVHVFQGESSQLSRNQSIGRFMLEGLNKTKNSDGEILVRFDLTLDGTLTVTAIERKTGVSKALKIDNALSQMSESGKQASEERMEFLFRDSEGFGSVVDGTVLSEEEEERNRNEWAQIGEPAVKNRVDGPGTHEPTVSQLVNRARSVRSSLSNDDADDIDRLIGLIESAEQENDKVLLEGLHAELEDLLFYLA